MTLLCRGKVCGGDWVTFGLGGGWHKKSQVGSCVWKNARLILFYRFRGVKDKGSEIG